jgi:hypothetical protein
MKQLWRQQVILCGERSLPSITLLQLERESTELWREILASDFDGFDFLPHQTRAPASKYLRLKQ